MSRPIRARGLKPNSKLCYDRIRTVAPHTGAWIETMCVSEIYSRPGRVAPHMGAWIETGIWDVFRVMLRSPLTRVYGFKQGMMAIYEASIDVAPFLGE